MKVFDSEIIRQRHITSNYYLVTFKTAIDIGQIIPGQFVMLSFSDRLDPLLPRPMAFFDQLERSDNRTIFTILYQVVGKGTSLLAKSPEKSVLRGTGPLGNGWNLEQLSNSENVFLLAGGIGISSMYLLAQELRRKKVNTTLLLGAPTKNDILMIDEFKNLGVDVVIFTEDGSFGVKGMVSEGIKKNIVNPDALVFACGPYGMLKRAYELLSPLGIDPLLSFDYRMACGFGVCLGCNIGVYDKSDKSVRQVRTCVEGPVFRGSEIAW